MTAPSGSHRQRESEGLREWKSSEGTSVPFPTALPSEVGDDSGTSRKPEGSSRGLWLLVPTSC